MRGTSATPSTPMTRAAQVPGPGPHSDPAVTRSGVLIAYSHRDRDLLGELGYYARANGPSFAAAILQAADDPAGRQARGRAGREAVQRTHSFAGIRAILHTWYERLRDRAASGG